MIVGVSELFYIVPNIRRYVYMYILPVLSEHVAYAKAEHGDTSFARKLFYDGFSSSFYGSDNDNGSAAYSRYRKRANLSYYLVKTGLNTAALAEAWIAVV